MSEVAIKREASTSSKNKKKNPLNMNLDLNTLNIMCRFIISESTYIGRYDFSQLRRIMQIVDVDKIARSGKEYNDRIKFVIYGLEAKLDARLYSKDAVLMYINQRIDNDIAIDIDTPISKEEMNFLRNYISNMLKFEFVYRDVDQIRNLCNEILTTNVAHSGDVIDRFESHIDMIKNEFRNMKAQDSSETIFSLKGERFVNQITDTFYKVKSPSRRLYTGMQGFNMLTNGLESGRVYMLFGTAGIGKSVVLLNLAFQIRKYNITYQLKDQTKTPCVVMLTMENSVTETIQRLFDLVRGNDGRPMESYNSPEEVLDTLKKNGELILTDESPIDIVIKYKPNRSVNTDYLYNLYDELEDEGYEPICFIQDHVKRIRAIDSDKDLRIELGNVVNEFKVFATLKDIPVISDSHLNRDASVKIDGVNKSKADITRMLGKENVGESLLMVDNLDMAIIINKEEEYLSSNPNDKITYIVFKTIKQRYNTQKDYICHPFELGSTIKLVEDVNNPNPAFKDTLRSSSNLLNNQYGNMFGPINTNTMFNNNKDNSNIFAQGTAYNINNVSEKTTSDREIPTFEPDDTPLTSDIADDFIIDEVPQIIPQKQRTKVNPFIYYNIPNTEDAKEVLDDICKMLA